LPAMRIFSSSKIVRFLLAPVLSLWVAGAGCMLGCEGMVAAASAPAGSEPNASTVSHSEHSLIIVASGHACSSGGAIASSRSAALPRALNNHHCCKRSSTEVKRKAQPASTSAGTLIESGERSSGMMKDCPLAASKLVVVTKSRRVGANASPAVAHAYLPAPNFQEQPTPLSTSRLLPNRGHTYLRCCVFLI
jgi:hypothetical protein